MTIKIRHKETREENQNFILSENAKAMKGGTNKMTLDKLIDKETGKEVQWIQGFEVTAVKTTYPNITDLTLGRITYEPHPETGELMKAAPLEYCANIFQVVEFPQEYTNNADEFFKETYSVYARIYLSQDGMKQYQKFKTHNCQMRPELIAGYQIIGREEKVSHQVVHFPEKYEFRKE